MAIKSNAFAYGKKGPGEWQKMGWISRQTGGFADSDAGQKAGWDKLGHLTRRADKIDPGAEIANITSVSNLFARGYLKLKIEEVGLRELAIQIARFTKTQQSEIQRKAVQRGARALSTAKRANADVQMIYNRLVEDRTGALKESLGFQRARPIILSRGAAFMKFRSRMTAPSRADQSAEREKEKKGGPNLIHAYGTRRIGRHKNKAPGGKVYENIPGYKLRNYWKPSRKVKRAAEKLEIVRTLKGTKQKRKGKIGGDGETIKPFKYAHLVERGTRRGGWRTFPSRAKPFFRAIYHAKRREIQHDMVGGAIEGTAIVIAKAFLKAERAAARRKTR